jgi:arsenite methyltransferase
MSASNKSSDSLSSSVGHSLSGSDWLDKHFLAMQPEYEEMLHWVGIQPNWHVLDAGCGTGGYLPLMTELVGKGGKVSAIDLAPENIQTVESRAEQSKWPTSVLARVGDVLKLPYENQSFDAVWCANTSQYFSDDEVHIMVKEFRRVVRPGGLIAIKDYDITARQIQPTTPTLCAHFHEALGRIDKQHHANLFRTIYLSSWLKEAGLIDIRQKPTLFVRFQPLRPIEKSFFRDDLKFSSTEAQKLDLPTEEQEIWKKLGDVNSPEHIINNPDFLFRGIQIVFVGRVP